jgi:hypothetical protein
LSTGRTSTISSAGVLAMPGILSAEEIEAINARRPQARERGWRPTAEAETAAASCP